MKQLTLTFTSFILFVVCLLGVPLFSAQAGDVTNVTVGLHQAELVTLPQDMTNVIIADRSVAGVVRHSGKKVSVIGHGLGKTDIRFMNGKRIVRQVNLTVTYDLPAIRQSLKSFFPNETMGLELVNQSLALTGMVSNAEVAAQAVKIVEEYTRNAPGSAGTGVLNMMQLRSGQQVMLRVRVGEIRRSAMERLGLGVYGVLASGASLLGALEKDKVFRALAEPSLTAISGETAQFLAGGEFPVPVMQGNNAMSVEYKSFGVSVDFTPFVLSENRIRLDVASEVSELSNAGAVSVASLNIPSVTTRRAHTTVELAPGESFMIAGLVRNDHTGRNLGDVPALGDIPVLSALFRSTEFQRNESELVVAVTPYLVDPVEGRDIRLPTDGSTPPNALDALFFGSLESRPGQKATPNLEGPVGYQID